jgi:hypothetical protein
LRRAFTFSGQKLVAHKSEVRVIRSPVWRVVAAGSGIKVKLVGKNLQKYHVRTRDGYGWRRRDDDRAAQMAALREASHEAATRTIGCAAMGEVTNPPKEKATPDLLVQLHAMGGTLLARSASTNDREKL